MLCRDIKQSSIINFCMPRGIYFRKYSPPGGGNDDRGKKMKGEEKKGKKGKGKKKKGKREKGKKKGEKGKRGRKRERGRKKGEVPPFPFTRFFFPLSLFPVFSSLLPFFAPFFLPFFLFFFPFSLFCPFFFFPFHFFPRPSFPPPRRGVFSEVK